MPASTTKTDDRVIRKPEARQITGMSDSTIRRLELEGRFPKRMRLGGSACGWLLSEVNQWLAERAAARG
jgi:prophage regulatory protein